MCLISKQTPHSVNYPIKVYKIVENRMGIPFMPYQHYAYDKSFPILTASWQCVSLQLRGDVYEYSAGFIHAYTEVDKAIEEIKRLQRIIGSKMYHIFEGEISPGTDFVVSEDMFTICARSITLKHRI